MIHKFMKFKMCIVHISVYDHEYDLQPLKTHHHKHQFKEEKNQPIFYQQIIIQETGLLRQSIFKYLTLKYPLSLRLLANRLHRTSLQKSCSVLSSSCIIFSTLDANISKPQAYCK